MRIPVPITAIAFLLIPLAGCALRQPAEKTPLRESNSETNVVTITADAARAAGIQIIEVHDKTATSNIQTTGQIEADENRVFHINSLVPGRVIDDKVLLGDLIQQGQTLAVIENLEVAKLYADFIRRYHENETSIKNAETRFDLAKSNWARTKQLYDEKIGSQKDFIQAQADYILARRAVTALNEKSTHIEEEAKSLLAAYGVVLKNIHSETLQTTSPIVAPRRGVITKKTITVGDVVSIQETLYEVADLSQLWLDISVFDKDLPNIKEGESVTFLSDSVPGRVFKGIISYIKPSTGDNTRTFLARANLQNPDLTLKPGMFGQVTIVGVHQERKPFVPDEAVQTYGNEKFVFVEQQRHQYIKQPISLAERLPDGYLVEKGVTPGERVVARGSLKLKAEMLKGRFSPSD